MASNGQNVAFEISSWLLFLEASSFQNIHMTVPCLKKHFFAFSFSSMAEFHEGKLIFSGKFAPRPLWNVDINRAASFALAVSFSTFHSLSFTINYSE
jgi:hypothetical protein